MPSNFPATRGVCWCTAASPRVSKTERLTVTKNAQTLQSGHGQQRDVCRRSKVAHLRALTIGAESGREEGAEMEGGRGRGREKTESGKGSKSKGKRSEGERKPKGGREEAEDLGMPALCHLPALPGHTTPLPGGPRDIRLLPSGLLRVVYLGRTPFTRRSSAPGAGTRLDFRDTYPPHIQGTAPLGWPGGGAGVSVRPLTTRPETGVWLAAHWVKGRGGALIKGIRGKI